MLIIVMIENYRSIIGPFRYWYWYDFDMIYLF